MSHRLNLSRAASRWRDELFWHYPHYWNGGNVSPDSVARVGDWKLIRFHESGREELYRLSDDPVERNDLASSADFQDQRRALADRLDGWLRDVKAQLPVPGNSPKDVRRTRP